MHASSVFVAQRYFQFQKQYGGGLYDNESALSIKFIIFFIIHTAWYLNSNSLERSILVMSSIGSARIIEMHFSIQPYWFYREEARGREGSTQ